MSEGVLCAIGKRRFTTQKAAAKILKVFEKDNLPKLQDSLALCPDCRRETFVRRMIGDELVRVPDKGPIPVRRKERLEPVRLDPGTGDTVLKSSCFSCKHGCDVLVHVKDGRVVKVEGDASSPTTRGILCAKGLASKSLVYHPERRRRLPSDPHAG